MTIREKAHEMKLASPYMGMTAAQQRNQALANAAEALEENREKIFAANREDLDRAEKSGVSVQVIKRLRFNEDKLRDVIGGIRMLIDLPDPTGKVLLKREIDEGLTLTKITCPIGVIGVIFEARPDALVQISSLCIKSGNCAVLKGGRETASTNKVLFDIIYEAVRAAGLPEACLFLAQQHSEIDELLTCAEDVDLLVPRGSNRFVQYIMDHTQIPVMGHSDGVCHIYVDKECDTDMAIRVIVDAKTQYPVACNTVETVLVHREIAPQFLPELKKALDQAGVAVRGSEEAAGYISCPVMGEDEYHTEYGDLKLSLKLVADVKEAVDHINKYGSHHTESVLTDNDETAAWFLQMVDSAGVYRNCSTRFADGFRYGFGAELGISTGKLHARGPVGLEGLVTYKYTLEGQGQIVADYAGGKSSFHYKELL